MNLREVSMKGMKRIRDSVRLGVSEIQQQVWRMKLSLPVMRRMWRRVSNRNSQVTKAAGTLRKGQNGDRVESVGQKPERECCQPWSTVVRAGSWQK